MKKIQLLAIIVLVTLTASAQSDSLAVITAHWEEQKIARGIVWKKCLFKNNLFASNQSINILEMRKSRKIKFAIGFDSAELKLTSEFGKGNKAIAALNGTFFDIKNGGSVDFLKVTGETIHNNRIQNNKRAMHQKAAIAMDGSKLKIEKWNGQTDWESRLPYANIMVSGPLLMLDGRFEPLDSSTFTFARHPRTAIAMTETKRVLFITVDGRDSNAAGMNLLELRKVLKWLGAKDGINLDGGGSTTLWIYNQPDNGIVNYPSDNKIWDHAGERKVANVVLVKKK